MKIVTKSFSVSSRTRNQMIDITGQVSTLVAESGINNGDLIVFCPHTTGAITINENVDPDVTSDILMTLEQLIPHLRPGYHHSEGNSDAHVKSSLVGCSEQILIANSELLLGTWQGLYFCEFDGPRNRHVTVQIRGE